MTSFEHQRAKFAGQLNRLKPKERWDFPRKGMTKAIFTCDQACAREMDVKCTQAGKKNSAKLLTNC